MKKIVKLKDGTIVTIRFLTVNDIDKSYEFFMTLPDEDRQYLRVDVTKKELVEKRIRDLSYKSIQRLVALVDDKIVADGAFEQEDHGWEKHIGEIRLIISKEYRRKGLGMLMAGLLYQLATQAGVEEIVVKMMRPQIDAQKIFRRLGFHHDVTLPDFVQDINKNKHDLIIMRCKLKELLEELEDYFYEKDMRHMVTHMF